MITEPSQRYTSAQKNKEQVSKKKKEQSACFEVEKWVQTTGDGSLSSEEVHQTCAPKEKHDNFVQFKQLSNIALVSKWMILDVLVDAYDKSEFLIRLNPLFNDLGHFKNLKYINLCLSDDNHNMQVVERKTHFEYHTIFKYLSNNSHLNIGYDFIELQKLKQLFTNCSAFNHIESLKVGFVTCTLYKDEEYEVVGCGSCSDLMNLGGAERQDIGRLGSTMHQCEENQFQRMASSFTSI
ncbi:hypothetical protein DFA_06494 [Cavenderia fasciculata]|uniref:Uncharacterized protein n=1 Tax=Cavenderia fasciculata TaxID=261658 RepID=F4PJ58_CACFS|nr:uncharacterized protein DFA_06494 [Cavenderia fasciculata]EGG24344.1 hypothetical protein DFA_06494 [Cavenderia fasciculata]|eukprot:XP_004362195.1 hypothetical protein DFA_06494 [Cavenderia fasciculata]